MRQSTRQEAEVPARGKMRANKSCRRGMRERLCQYIYFLLFENAAFVMYNRGTSFNYSKIRFVKHDKDAVFFLF